MLTSHDREAFQPSVACSAEIQSPRNRQKVLLTRSGATGTLRMSPSSGALGRHLAPLVNGPREAIYPSNLSARGLSDVLTQICCTPDRKHCLNPIPSSIW